MSIFVTMFGMTKLAMIKFGEDTGLDLTASETLPPADNIDSVEDTVSYVGSFLKWIQNYAVEVALPVAIRIAIAIIIFMVGRFFVKKLIAFMDKSLRKTSMEEGVIHFLNSLANGAGILVMIAICANYLNIGTGAIVAVLGSAGLAIGLSLQGSLANFAGGIVLLVSKPFLIGDYIIALGNEGVVVGIDMVYTTLLTPDNRKIVLPNGSLSGANIVNVTFAEKRRLDLTIGVDYSSDIKKVKDILEEIANKQETVLKDEDITVFVNAFESSSISMGLRVWTTCEDFWATKWAIQEEIKAKFDENGISIPFDRMDVTVLNEQSK